MSKYTTGEIAKLCGVTVRTVQYYDTRGILVPSELSEGGRRLYSEDDLRRLKIICFLRELSLPIDAISQILAEKNPGNLIGLLLEQQEQDLKEEIGERQEQLDKLTELRHELNHLNSVTAESIGDIAYTMSNKKKLRKIHMTLVAVGLPFSLYEIFAIIYGFMTGNWWYFAAYIILSIPYAYFMTKYYHRHIAYICPDCHTIFVPSYREMLFARHTPSARKLTCTSCGYNGYCVEVPAEETAK